MLYQVFTANTLSCHIIAETVDYIKLMETRKDKPLGVLKQMRNFLVLLSLAIVNEGKVLNNVSKGYQV